MSLAERMDHLVVKSTIAWSYGPVDIHTLYDEVPGDHYVVVAKRIGDLYSPLILKSIEAGLAACTLLLNQKEASH